MKYCRTLNGLLKSINKGESCRMKYTNKSRTNNDHIIYQANGTNLIIGNATFKKIEPYLQQV